MPTLTLKNVPEALYERLKARAARHGRCLEDEVLAALQAFICPEPEGEDALPDPRADPEAFLEYIRVQRERLPPDLYVTEEELDRAINEGRP